ncbi:MAG: aminopeptidase P family protein [Clostridia bacterium]|nr:aminopeptidase P family protein [Clostridia bacterium]
MENINDFKVCLELNALAFDAVKRDLRAGMTEKDVKNIILGAWRKRLGFDPPSSGDIVSGANKDRIEGDATDRVIKKGDTLILDLQPTYNGVFADTTRTFFIGEPTKRAKEVYKALLDAMKGTESRIKAGTKAKDVYFAMQDILADSGLFCPHHAGHRVGEKKLMEPEFLPDREEKITENTFAALEPGFYEDGLGIRIENNYLVKKDSCENLFGYPLDLEYFILRNGETKK